MISHNPKFFNYISLTFSTYHGHVGGASSPEHGDSLAMPTVALLNDGLLLQSGVM